MATKRNSGLVSSINDIKERDKASVRLTVPVRPDQEEVLTRIVRTINQSRDKEHRRERITKATVIRAFVDALSAVPIQLRNVSDERTLLERVLNALQAR